MFKPQLEPRVEIKIQLENRRSGIILHFLIKCFHYSSYLFPSVEHPVLTRQGLSIKGCFSSQLKRKFPLFDRKKVGEINFSFSIATPGERISLTDNSASKYFLWEKKRK